MKKMKLVSALLALIMVLGSIGATTVSAAWADKVDEDGDPIIDYINTAYESADAKLADMVLKKEQNGYQLWIEEFTGEVAIVDTTSGQILFSNPYDVASSYSTISEATKQKLLSQILITYLDNDVQKTMYSYNEAALRGQIIIKNIKNGVRVEYTLGEEATTRLVPRLIEKSRFEELIVANIDNDWLRDKLTSFYTLKDPDDTTLTERGVKEMQSKFPITLEMAVYVCDPEIKTRELRELENIIKTYCPLYTYEELDYDHELTNYEGDDAAPPRFKLALEYTLSDDGLEVRLPANGITFDESAYQFDTVTVLPYMGAGSNQYTGYTFIPDGSGALIRFEDVKNYTYNVSGQLYGSDYAYHEISGQHAEVMRLPVYGVCTDYTRSWTETEETVISEEYVDETTGETVPAVIQKDTIAHEEAYTNGFLAIITEGDSLATLMSEHGGALHPYNTVYAMFTPRPSDTYQLSDSSSSKGSGSWTVTSSRKYTGSYRIKYIMLTDDTIADEKGISDYYTASYVGMAKAYQDYLVSEGVLVALEDNTEDIPLYIESFGSIETTKRILSIPVTVDTALTTFDDVKTMYEELSAQGITNINFKLTGFANGGMDSTVPYRLKWVDVVGGKSGFEDLIDYAKGTGMTVYPEFDFVYITAMDTLDGVSLKKHAVKTIDSRYTSKRTYDAATQSFDRSFALAISPSVYSYFYNKFGPIYAEYQNDAISVSTLGTDLNSDFDKKDPYHREDSKEFTIDLLDNISNDIDNVMIEGGNAYALRYADTILDVALTSSKYVKASQSVPFTGMVLHGYKEFTGSAINMEGDTDSAILTAIESGASLYFTLSYQNTSKLKEDNQLNEFYSVSYEIWKDDVVNYYNELNNAIGDLQHSSIVDHEFLNGERIPDADELEADALAAEAEAAALAEAEAAALEKEERAARLAARLAAENGTVVEETPVVDETAATDETADTTETPVTDEEEGIIVEEDTGETGLTVAEKYQTTTGSIVRVEYEGGVNFILNYNSFDVIVEYNGTSYTIGSLDFVRIG